MLGQILDVTLETARQKLLGRYTTWIADDFARFAGSPAYGNAGDSNPFDAHRSSVPPPPLSRAWWAVSWETTDHESVVANRLARAREKERLFSLYCSTGAFDRPWELLTPEAQAQWHSRECFIEGMHQQASTTTVVAARVMGATMLSTWQDPHNGTTHQDVAQVNVSYQVCCEGSMWNLLRDVHWIWVDGDWRSPCYPP